MKSVATFRDEFPHIAAGYVHLNHAGISSPSKRVMDRMTGALERLSVDAIDGLHWAFGEYQACRDRLARLMGVLADDLALTKNTAHGVSIVADGLDWREGDEVVFASCEYPANSYPWLAQADRGVRCITVDPRPDGRVPVEDYEAAMTPRTRMIAVSWVQFATGYRADLAELTRLAHSRGALIAVDVIQGLGAFPLDLTALGVDFAATGSQKWLLGPMGVGGLYIRRAALDRLRLVNMGAGAVKNVTAFDTMALDVKATAQRYEEGTPNLIGCIGLAGSLEMLEEYGVDAVSERVLLLTRYAMDRLDARGYLLDTPRADRDRAGMVLFRHPKLTTDEIVGVLRDAKINVVARGGRARFAPHFYNTPEDIDRAIDSLP